MTGGRTSAGWTVERSFAVRLALFYAAYFTILGFYLPYLPVWLAWRGMTPAEIGMLTAAPLFLRVVATPLITFWADVRGDHRETMIIGTWIGLGAATALSIAYGFWPILGLILIFQSTNQSVLPLAEATALSGVRTYGLDYGRIRLWGSVTFIVANLAGGLFLAWFGGGVVIMLVVGAVAAAVGAAHTLPRRARSPEAADAGGTAKRRIRVRDLGTLVTTPWFVLLMAASGCIQASHAVYYAFSAIHWRALGISDGWIGGLWALGVVAEVGLFAISARLLRWIGATGLVVVGGLAGIVRWAAMAFDPPFATLIVLQTLHALTFGATFLGVLHVLQGSVPEEQSGSAQGLHASLAPGIIMGSVTILAGQIYAPLGALSYLVMAGMSVLGTACALVLLRSAPASMIGRRQAKAAANA